MEWLPVVWQRGFSVQFREFFVYICSYVSASRKRGSELLDCKMKHALCQCEIHLECKCSRNFSLHIQYVMWGLLNNEIKLKLMIARVNKMLNCSYFNVGATDWIFLNRLTVLKPNCFGFKFNHFKFDFELNLFILKYVCKCWYIFKLTSSWQAIIEDNFCSKYIQTCLSLTWTWWSFKLKSLQVGLKSLRINSISLTNMNGERKVMNRDRYLWWASLVSRMFLLVLPTWSCACTEHLRYKQTPDYAIVYLPDSLSIQYLEFFVIFFFALWCLKFFRLQNLIIAIRYQLRKTTML